MYHYVPLLPRVYHFRCRRYELGYFQWLYDEAPMFCPHTAYPCLFSGRIPFHSHSTCRKCYTQWSFQDPKSEVPAIFLRPKFQGICPPKYGLKNGTVR